MQPKDSDDVDCFELKVNGDHLAKLFYLSPDFQLIEHEIEVYNAGLKINGIDVTEYHHGQFNWRPTTLSHMLVRSLQD